MPSILSISYPCCLNGSCLLYTLFPKLVSSFQNIVSTTDVIKRQIH